MYQIKKAWIVIIKVFILKIQLNKYIEIHQYGHGFNFLHGTNNIVCVWIQQKFNVRMVRIIDSNLFRGGQTVRAAIKPVAEEEKQSKKEAKS